MIHGETEFAILEPRPEYLGGEIVSRSSHQGCVQDTESFVFVFDAIHGPRSRSYPVWPWPRCNWRGGPVLVVVVFVVVIVVGTSVAMGGPISLHVMVGCLNCLVVIFVPYDSFIELEFRWWSS